ncbi:hypothetical protein ACU686_08760 [Yinghuangia aomiensis]
MRNRFRSGEPEALAQLYDENAQVLYRYALRVTGNWGSRTARSAGRRPRCTRSRAGARPPSRRRRARTRRR